MITNNLFFVIGPLRTGSSLMSRCVDDHPDAICLCESEANRALFRDYFTTLHFHRMRQHGFTPPEIMNLLNGRKQDRVQSLIGWYHNSQNRCSELYGKPSVRAFGDKSPDYFRSEELVTHLIQNYRLIYTVRDPRAIYCSIVTQANSTPTEHNNRWKNLTRNFLAWEKWLDHQNLLATRYEDLIHSPEQTMAAVYRHIGLEPSLQFLQPFERLYPKRFLWETAVDWESGIRREFDPSRIDRWKNRLSDDDLKLIAADSNVLRFMERFGYDWD